MFMYSDSSILRNLKKLLVHFLVAVYENYVLSNVVRKEVIYETPIETYFVRESIVIEDQGGAPFAQNNQRIIIIIMLLCVVAMFFTLSDLVQGRMQTVALGNKFFSSF